MNADEMNWLLRTIEGPRAAKRFVQAQYERGRVSYQVVADLVREHGWTNYQALRVLTATSTSMAYVGAQEVLLSATGAIS
jgi:hypothetical protein